MITSIMSHDSVCSKHESLTGEDTRTTWGISIESLMGERNKIERAICQKAAQKTSRNGRFLRYVHLASVSDTFL